MSQISWQPASPSELCQILAENAHGARHVMIPVGGGTGLSYGGVITGDGVSVSLAGLNRILDFPARDMTITVEAGVTWDRLAQELASQGQRLPVDVPQSDRATVGGAVATNVSGPSRFGHGTFRDYVIGVSAVDASGRLFSAGGRVVKNVAGYDLCKMLIGSLGSLALITQLTFKLRPLAIEMRSLWATFRSGAAVDRALERINLSATRPTFIELCNQAAANRLAIAQQGKVPLSRWNLCLGYEGTARELAWQIGTAQTELSPFQAEELVVCETADADECRRSLIEFSVDPRSPLTFKATMPPSRVVDFIEAATDRGVAVGAHAGNGVVMGHLPAEMTEASAAAQLITPLRSLAEQASGSLVVWHCDDSWKEIVNIFGQPRDSWKWMDRLKKQLDPGNLLNPGRWPFLIEAPAVR